MGIINTKSFSALDKAINKFVDNIKNEIMAEEKKMNAAKETTKNVKLSSPWIIYYRKLVALFGEDPEIHISLDEDENVVTMRVDSAKKAEALTHIIPETVAFGNVILNIKIVPANDLGNTRADILRNAFEGNPIFEDIIVAPSSLPLVGSNTYVMFKKNVAQFYADNMADPYGNAAYLYQDLAEEIIGHPVPDGVYFCTGISMNKYCQVQRDKDKCCSEE